MPNHKELAPGLLRAILSQVGVQVKDFLKKIYRLNLFIVYPVSPHLIPNYLFQDFLV